MKETDTVASEQVDVRDMIVVHTALLREVRLAPRAVVRAGGQSRRRCARTARHLRLVLDVLEHHHSGEDRLMLPLLRARAPRESMRAVDTGEEQHARIEGLITEVRAAVGRWAGGDQDAAPVLVERLTDLHAALEPHLRGEERDVLPLAARYLDPAEWRAVGEAGFLAIPKPALTTVFGMLMYEGDPEVLRSMLAHAPAVPRLLLPRIAPGAYARRSQAVYGTRRP